MVHQFIIISQTIEMSEIKFVLLKKQNKNTSLLDLESNLKAIKSQQKVIKIAKKSSKNSP
jgi:hypothetical protein